MVLTDFQAMHNLPITGEPDDATISLIERELAVLDAQPYKKKRSRLWPKGPPGTLIKDPVP